MLILLCVTLHRVIKITMINYISTNNLIYLDRIFDYHNLQIDIIYNGDYGKTLF